MDNGQNWGWNEPATEKVCNEWACMWSQMILLDNELVDLLTIVEVGYFHETLCCAVIEHNVIRFSPVLYLNLYVWEIPRTSAVFWVKSLKFAQSTLFTRQWILCNSNLQRDYVCSECYIEDKNRWLHWVEKKVGIVQKLNVYRTTNQMCQYFLYRYSIKLNVFSGRNNEISK